MTDWRTLPTCECGCGKPVTIYRGTPRRFVVGHSPVSKMTLKERLMAEVTKDETTGCWMWTGALGGNGYGQIKHQRVRHVASRASYEVHVGPIGDGLEVCHRCDTPRCVNPDHLFLGTHAENMGDSKAKGRTRGASKITVADVHRIRELTAQGVTRPEIVTQLGIDYWTVRNVQTGRNWKAA